MKKRIIIYIVIFQIILAAIVIRHFFDKKTISVDALGGFVVEPTLIKGLPGFYEPIPNTNISSDLSWMGNNFKYRITYTINSVGFNQIQDFPTEKNKNVFRIMTIGDSFTFGANVNTKDNYPSQLQNVIKRQCKTNKRIEILNLGVPGYDFQYSGERYLLRGKQYDPDLLVWLIIPDQLMRINRLYSAKAEQYRKLLFSTKEGREKLHNIPSAHLSLAKEAVEKELGEQKILEEQYKQLEKFNSVYSRALIFATFIDSRFTNRQRKFINDFVNSRPGSFFYNNMRSLGVSKGLLPDFHPNSRGHGIIAQDVFGYLKKNKLIPCN